MRIAALVLLVGACAPAHPPRRPIATEALPMPDPPPRQRLVVPEGGFLTLVADDVVSCSADGAGLFDVYHADASSLVLRGRKAGKATLHLRRSAARWTDVDVDVVTGAGEPRPQALVVGETITFSAHGIKEFAKSGPDVVDLVFVPDGGAGVVTARRPGRQAIVLIHDDGTVETREFLVAGGARCL